MSNKKSAKVLALEKERDELERQIDELEQKIRQDETEETIWDRLSRQTIHIYVDELYD